MIVIETPASDVTIIYVAIHPEALAAQRPPQPEPIYYCATGTEMPLYEPCKDRKEHLMAANHIHLVVVDGSPVTAFTDRCTLIAYLKRRLDTFINNPLVYEFAGDGYAPSIMTMSAALAE